MSPDQNVSEFYSNGFYVRIEYRPSRREQKQFRALSGVVYNMGIPPVEDYYDATLYKDTLNGPMSIHFKVRLFSPEGSEEWRKPLAVLDGPVPLAKLSQEFRDYFKGYHLLDTDDVYVFERDQLARNRMKRWIDDRAELELKNYRKYWGIQ